MSSITVVMLLDGVVVLQHFPGVSQEQICIMQRVNRDFILDAAGEVCPSGLKGMSVEEFEEGYFGPLAQKLVNKLYDASLFEKVKVDGESFVTLTRKGRLVLDVLTYKES